jgi:DUF4097 and DUF4098 domain-containing protein YvlB
VDAIRRAEFRDQGSDVHLKLNEGDTSSVTVGGVQVGNNNVQVSGMTLGSGGVTVVNGVVYGAGRNSFVSSGPITVRAITEPGSAVEVKTMSGDVITKNVATVRAQTMSGDITVTGLGTGASLKSMSGDIRVSGDGRTAPRVTAKTMSGDVTGAGVDLHASSMSGRVRQQRLTAADEC